MYLVDTYNNFQDDQGNKPCIGELKYVSKKGKQALSCVDNVPARDVKSALSLKCGAGLGGSKSNAVNLILRLFWYHFLHTMSS